LIKNQIENFEKLKSERIDEIDETESEIQKLKEEISNINSTIIENNVIKEKISISLEVDININ
jgi:hypothetical protein